MLSKRRGEALDFVAREGEQSPGTPNGTTFTNFPFRSSAAGAFFLNELTLNNAGQTVFRSEILGAETDILDRRAIFRKDADTGLELVVRAGEQTPNEALGVNFLEFGSRLGLRSGSPTSFDFFVGPPTGAENPPDDLFSKVGFGPALNDAGQLAFRSVLVGPGIDRPRGFDDDSNAIFRSSGSAGLVQVAREGQQAPGTSSGVNFRILGSPVLNNAGQTAFRALLEGEGVSSGFTPPNATMESPPRNDNAIFSEGGSGGLALVARAGDQVAGQPAGVLFANFLQQPVLNSAGHTAFIAELSSSTDSADFQASMSEFEQQDVGLFSEGRGAGLALVVRSGDQAPGTPSGVTFAKFNVVPPVQNGGPEIERDDPEFSFGNPVFNGLGQTAFVGTLTGDGIDDTNDNGIWAQALDGTLVLIAREGDLLDVNDDPLIEDLRTISELEFAGGTGNQDGRRSGFNELGQLAFYAEFTDGTSGVFVSSAVAVPEPTSVVLVAFAMSTMLVRRQKM